MGNGGAEGPGNTGLPRTPPSSLPLTGTGTQVPEDSKQCSSIQAEVGDGWNVGSQA